MDRYDVVRYNANKISDIEDVTVIYDNLPLAEACDWALWLTETRRKSTYGIQKAK